MSKKLVRKNKSKKKHTGFSDFASMTYSSQDPVTPKASQDLEAQRRFIQRIEKLSQRRPKDEAFMEDFLALLKDGYEEDLEILCPGITDPWDRSAAKQGNVTLDDGSKYLLCVTHMSYASVFASSGLSVQDLMIRDVVDRVLDTDIYEGLLFDYQTPTGSFFVKKADLHRVIRGE